MYCQQSISWYCVRSCKKYYGVSNIFCSGQIATYECTLKVPQQSWWDFEDQHRQMLCSGIERVHSECVASIVWEQGMTWRPGIFEA